MPISKIICRVRSRDGEHAQDARESSDDKFAWKPHEKSSSLGGLATHLANIPSWTAQTFDRDELDIARRVSLLTGWKKQSRAPNCSPHLIRTWRPRGGAGGCGR